MYHSFWVCLFAVVGGMLCKSDKPYIINIEWRNNRTCICMHNVHTLHTSFFLLSACIPPLFSVKFLLFPFSPFWGLNRWGVMILDPSLEMWLEVRIRMADSCHATQSAKVFEIMSEREPWSRRANRPAPIRVQCRGATTLLACSSDRQSMAAGGRPRMAAWYGVTQTLSIILLLLGGWGGVKEPAHAYVDSSKQRLQSTQALLAQPRSGAHWSHVFLQCRPPPSRAGRPPWCHLPPPLARMLLLVTCAAAGLRCRRTRSSCRHARVQQHQVRCVPLHARTHTHTHTCGRDLSWWRRSTFRDVDNVSSFIKYWSANFIEWVINQIILIHT